MRRAVMAMVAGILAVVPVGATSPTNALAASFTKTTAATFHATNLGPAHNHSCDILYDLYVPNDATPAHQVPVILTTNGFGGSKDDAAGVAAIWAAHDYEVLSYSGLGFGGSSCPIELDSPEWDGAAASELVTFLGGRAEVLKDNAATHDPRIGTWGGSYGGGFQFALAAVDSRVDAMVPEITWNDLSYSLIPNNYSPTLLYNQFANPGVEKMEWINVFFGVGNAEVAMHPGLSGWTDNVGGAPATGSFNPACPGFDQSACTAYEQGVSDGYPNPTTINVLHAVSAQQRYFQGCPAGRYPPTLLAQGQNDTLFNVADAVANYRGTKSCGGTAKLVLKEGGHSGPDAPGEYSDTNLSKGYLTQMQLNWFDRYLKGASVSTGPEVEYFRDWVTYDHNGSAAPAYGSAPAWPVGTTKTLYFSAGGQLVPSVAQVVAGAVSFAAPVQAPFSYSETSEFQSSGLDTIPPTDPPGTFAAFTTGAVTENVESVGIPTADFMLSDANPVAPLPSMDVVLFGKIYDLDAAGNKTLVHRIVAPVRVVDTTKPVHINLPGTVHQYAKGHRIQLVLATTDAAYVGSRAPHALTIAPDPQRPGTLTLPVMSAAEGNAIPAPSAAGPGALPNTAATSPSALMAATSPLIVLAVALTVRYRRRRRRLSR